MARCPYCDGEVPENVQKCRHCGEWLKEGGSGAAPIPTVTAKLKKKNELVGEGCALQGLGLVVGVVLFVFLPDTGYILGPVVAIGLLQYGGRKSLKWACGNCGNQVGDKSVRICPACRANLRK
jgi:hypothetical protein